MHGWLKSLLVLLAFAAIITGIAAWYLGTADEREPSRVAFMEHCADCHGAELGGSAAAPALAGLPLRRGESVGELMASIVEAHPGQDVALWRESISVASIKALALYISERRQQWPTTSESYALAFSEREVESRYHRFRLERFVELESRPYAIAPLPDGGILVSEKVRGLSIVDLAGKQGELISGTPRVWDPVATVGGSFVNLGSLLDVELHPDYENNGWIYLSHAHRCQFDCGSAWPVSMVRVLRGRIRQGRWVDEELIWSVHPSYYTVVPDAVAAGRLAFDGKGHVFVSVGGKAPYRNLHDLDTPYGKIHRVAEDGTVPEDNPFYLPAEDREQSSTRHTVYSYGHRTAQGLTSQPGSGAIWSTEMGPRGGDEVNRIIAGGNYGWPLYTGGLDYDGQPISIGRDLGLDFDYADTVPPVVDFTPAPAISNFTFHQGRRFPGWKNDLLIGTLKARTLYRVRIEGGEVAELEKLVTGLGRIRDVEMGPDGLVYVAIEHGENGSLVRLVPQS